MRVIQALREIVALESAAGILLAIAAVAALTLANSPRRFRVRQTGVGADRAGISRLPVLAARGIAAATVDCMSARIGDGRSMWETGVLSHVNAVAQQAGARLGDFVRDLVALLAKSVPRRPS